MKKFQGAWPSSSSLLSICSRSWEPKFTCSVIKTRFLQGPLEGRWLITDVRVQPTISRQIKLDKAGLP